MVQMIIDLAGTRYKIKHDRYTDEFRLKDRIEKAIETYSNYAQEEKTLKALFFSMTNEGYLIEKSKSKTGTAIEVPFNLNIKKKRGNK